MISQLKEGLKTCGLFQSVLEYPEILKDLFCKITKELGEDGFLSLFTVNFGEQQHKKSEEVDTYKAISDYVGMVSKCGY